MELALRNTAIGLVTVFIILILLCFVISLFRFIAPKKKSTKSSAQPAVLPVYKTKEDSVDDEELIAVIMAAVAAASGGTVDPNRYRVTSIKKTGMTARWKRSGRR